MPYGLRIRRSGALSQDEGAAVQGAWHRTTVQNLVPYGWELAWRQEMVGQSNCEQLADLLQRVVRSGRPDRFIDYWQKRPKKARPPKPATGVLREVDCKLVKLNRGSPAKGTVRLQRPDQGAPDEPMVTEGSK